jgi:thymidine phosphorylase
MKTEAQARVLAETMVRIGEDAGVRTVAALSAMDQPLGRTVGNALEVAEAIAILRGTGPQDVTDLCLHETATLLAMAGLVADEAHGIAHAERAIGDGAGLAKLAEVVAAQGGDAALVEHPERLPRAPHHETLLAPRSGYITRIDAERIGMASVRLGAGRLKKGEPIDHAVGLVLLAKLGDTVEAGAPLVEVHARTTADVASIRDGLLAAYTFGDEAPTQQPLLLGQVSRATPRRGAARKR